MVNCDDIIKEYWAKCTQNLGYAWERTLKKIKILEMFYCHLSLSPKRDAQKEHMLIQELEFLSSGYLRFNFIFIEKNNLIL